MSRHSWTAERVIALGSTTTLTTAGQILGIGRTKSYTLAHAGTFPVPVIRIGTRYTVPVAPLLALLGIGKETGGIRLTENDGSSINENPAAPTRPSHHTNPRKETGHGERGNHL
ncbi:hypothetical protein [Candidatus Protofrankia californiensis]|uniref:hypothetical protein n=1 Tax=Candidatus Protofrankia californiensis TaxID=1839754 RepID=UPI0019D07994|nr:hypothetical protein [Candidatus Protofrankia californiensis]